MMIDEYCLDNNTMIPLTWWCALLCKLTRIEGFCEKCSWWWMIFHSFSAFFFSSFSLCCVFIFSTSSRCRYRCHWDRNQSPSVFVGQSSRSLWVPSCGRLCRPLPLPPGPLDVPPPLPRLSSWSASVPPPAARSPLLSSHKRKPLLCLSFTLHTATVIHEQHLGHGSSVPVRSRWPGQRATLWPF